MRFSKGFLKEFFIALHPWVKRSKFGLDRSSHNEQCSKLRIKECHLPQKKSMLILAFFTLNYNQNCSKFFKH